MNYVWTKFIYFTMQQQNLAIFHHSHSAAKIISLYQQKYININSTRESKILSVKHYYGS